MLRIATIAAAEYDWSHGTTFAQIVNGCSRRNARAAGTVYVPPGRALANDARVVAIWTPDPQRSKVVAKHLRIPDVLSRYDEAVGQVDGIICCDDGCQRANRNGRWALPYIAAGTPAFLDKPLSDSAREAEEIVSLARQKGTPVLACSGLRYARRVMTLRARLGEMGALASAHAVGPLGWLIFYGVHALDPLVSLFGTGATWVQDVGREGHHVVHVGHEGNRSLVFQSLSGMAYGFHYALFGKKAAAQVTVEPTSQDFARQRFHVRTAEVFLDMFRTGRMPVPYDEMLEVAKILTYAKASLASGGQRFDLDAPPPN